MRLLNLAQGPLGGALTLGVLLSLPSLSHAQDSVLTPKHEAGRCAMRGTCKPGGWFSTGLPCPDNDPAEEPSADTRDRLVQVCGDEWKDGPICCTDDQIETLSSNLAKAANLISSCPACKANFDNLFCTFTCSPNQSLFVNVTETEKQDDGKYAITELDNFWSDEYGKAFYDSCKDVKFGGTGGKAMDLIGGGAKNYTDFLAFLGHKSALVGSPFQINFPRPDGREKEGGIKVSDPVKRRCNDDNEAYRCACVDCPDVCPELEAIPQADHCHVGYLPCLSFASIIVYCSLLLLGAAAVIGHIVAFRYKRERNERLRLLQDAAPSDDEDEGDLVHNAGLLDRPTRPYAINQVCESIFSSLGRFCARYPLIVVSSSVLVVGFLSLGWIRFGIERDPVRLWVSPTSIAAQEKAFFDDNFGAFYRVEQAFLTNASSADDAVVLSEETLRWWYEFEKSVERMRSRDGSVTLSDVCFNPTGNGCVVQSVNAYFPGGITQDWRQTIKQCTSQPSECLPEYGQPLNKEYILGGYIDVDNVLSAKSLTTTWVVNSVPQDSNEEATVADWEQALIHRFHIASVAAKERGLHLSYSTEASLEQELNKSSNTDGQVVAISYVVMFIYASIALGSSSLSLRALLSSPASAFVRSNFSLGVAGIVIVLMSVSASVGLFSAFNVKSTLIIAEVIPFLVLAVGVDNIFLIVHEFERVNKDRMDELIETRMAKALGRMGPSILLSGLTETVAFALGTVVGMPAVRNFAIYATGAVVINALLQVTMFVAVLALNQRRVEANRIDCIPCVKIRQNPGAIYGAASYGAAGESWLQLSIRKYYAPLLLDRRVKVAVVTLFLGVFAAGVALLPEVQLGLDQKIALPRDSYLINYFEDLERYYETGPPIYFVTRNTNITQRQHQQQLCGRFTTCKTFSLPTVLEQESKRPNESYVTGASANWVDDFFFFLNPSNEECCVEQGKACFANRDPGWNITMYGMPEGEEFVHYLHKYLETPTDASCLGGEALYSGAIVINDQDSTVPASYFRTSHTPLHSQEDYINSLASARRICSDIKAEHDIDVFPYSKHYIFFEQYASIVRLTGALLGSALGLILLVTTVLLGSLATGLVVTLTVGMILVDILGAMALGGVSLNAISLVNLVICVGIGVEFCAHIARAFAFPSRSLGASSRNKYRGRDARVWTSLVNVGASVFSGITITKLLGVSVLAFTSSKIFEIFYFRVWIALVAFAATHALIWLPVVLSLVGGAGYLDSSDAAAFADGSSGLDDDLAARRYRALLPGDDEYDYDSDEY